MKLAVAQHNAKPGVTQVLLVNYDTTGSSTQAAVEAQKAVSDDDVAVVGPTLSGEADASDPILEHAGIVNITPSATDPTLGENGWKYFHRAVGDDNVQGQEAVNYMTGKLQVKNIAVIDDNEAYSSGIANIVASTASMENVNVVMRGHVAMDGQDYSAMIDKIKAAGNLDAIFYGGYYSDAGRFLKQLRAAGVTTTFLSDDGADDPQLIATAGAAAAEGALFTCFCGDINDSTDPAAQAFVAAYTASAGAPPGNYSAEAYDSTNMILSAIDADNTTSAAIDLYLSTLNYIGLAKTYNFDADGEVESPVVYLWEVKGSKLVYDGPVDQLDAS